MATQNAINNESNPLAVTAQTVDPGASGDSAIQFDINTTGEFIIGVDDTDGDAFKISQGSALGTNDTFDMTANGEITMPLQSAFLAHLTSNDNNRTGSSAYILGTNTAFTEIYDQNSDFNTNGTFTAPVTGRYFLYAHVKVGDIGAGMVSAIIYMITSNRTYTANFNSAVAVADASNEIGYQIKCVADMDASDTAQVQILITGAADTADILGQATDPITWFCGYLAV